MAFEVNGVMIYEWPWLSGGEIIPVETETGIWDPRVEQFPDPIPEDLKAIYGEGDDQGPLPAVELKLPVEDEVLPLVTALGDEVAVGVLAALADELWLPGEREDATYWVTNGQAKTQDLLMGGEAVIGVALGGLVAGIWAFIWPLLIAAVMAWLGDKISGGAGEKAIYYKGVKIGRVTSDGKIKGVGVQGL